MCLTVIEYDAQNEVKQLKETLAAAPVEDQLSLINQKLALEDFIVSVEHEIQHTQEGICNRLRNAACSHAV